MSAVQVRLCPVDKSRSRKGLRSCDFLRFARDGLPSQNGGRIRLLYWLANRLSGVEPPDRADSSWDRNCLAYFYDYSEPVEDLAGFSWQQSPFGFAKVVL